MYMVQPLATEFFQNDKTNFSFACFKITTEDFLIEREISMKLVI